MSKRQYRFRRHRRRSLGVCTMGLAYISVDPSACGASRMLMFAGVPSSGLSTSPLKLNPHRAFLVQRLYPDLEMNASGSMRIFGGRVTWYHMAISRVYKRSNCILTCFVAGPNNTIFAWINVLAKISSSVYPSSGLDCPVLGTNDYTMKGMFVLCPSKVWTRNFER